MNTWEYEMSLFPPTGPPETTPYFERHYRDDPKQPIDCVVYYDHKGELVGVIEHYPQDIYSPTAPEGEPVAHKGAVVIWCRPDVDFVATSLILCKEGARIGWDDVDPAKEWDRYFPHCKDAARAWYKTWPEWKAGKKFDPDAAEAARATKDKPTE